jgi:hypothetical protein
VETFCHFQGLCNIVQYCTILHKSRKEICRNTDARSGGQASRFCAQQNRCVNPILSPLHLEIINIRPYDCNVDLVPCENAQAWLKHLRHSTPTLPFRSAGPHQRTNLVSGTAPALLRLKAYKPSAAQSVTVGVVGFPNVGKSSLINTLKRDKVSCRISLG